MTEAVTLLQELAALDVRLTVQDGRLSADAPKGAITPDLAARIQAHKDALLHALRSETEATPHQLGQQSGHCGSCQHWTPDGLGDYLGLCALGWKAHDLPHLTGPVLVTMHSPCGAYDGQAWRARKEQP